MTSLDVTIQNQLTTTYPIYIGNYMLSTLSEHVDLSGYSKICILTDTNTAPHYLELVKQSLPDGTVSCIVEPGEKAKTIETTQHIWQTMIESGMDRKSLLINLGGGVIGDMGSFAASTYMRGIDFVNIPTTLLAQVDESVGGKTGIDLNAYKNIVGTFMQPAAVIIDVSTLTTLPDREFNSGFAEIIKHGLIIDKAYFNHVASKKPREFTEQELIEIIKRSCEIKRDIVQKDTKESGLRKLVNYGHTVGHAIESLMLETDKPLLHGEAVSIGMVVEAEIAASLGLIKADEMKTIEASLEQADLPITVPALEIEAIIAKTKSDKKNVGGKVHWTLLNGLGNASFNVQADESLLREALKKHYE